MSRTDSKNPERAERFTWRTSVERGRQFKTRAFQLDITYEALFDIMWDRYARQVKQAEPDAPRNQNEVAYSEKVIHFLRDPKAPPIARAILDIILGKY